jgi:hypothetical protein
MLSMVSSYPRWLAQMRSTPASPFLDSFVAALSKAGYHTTTIQEFVRDGAHLSLWLKYRGQTLIEHGAIEIDRFKRHFASCSCPHVRRSSRRLGRGAELLLRHLEDIGVIARPVPPAPQQPALLADLCRWMQQHRGTKAQTLTIYGRVISEALRALGDDPSQYDARHLRAFVLERAPRFGRSKAKQVVTALRAFVRYLIAQGRRTSNVSWLPATRQPRSAHAIEPRCCSCVDSGSAPGTWPIYTGATLTGSRLPSRS